MARYYGSGLIGLDVKPRRIGRARRNRVAHHSIGRWLIPAMVLAATLGLFLLAGAR